jgi:hypothetical protein
LVFQVVSFLQVYQPKLCTHLYPPQLRATCHADLILPFFKIT